MRPGLHPLGTSRPLNAADVALADGSAPGAEATGHPADEPVDASRAAITVGGAPFDLPPLDLLDRGDPPAQPADTTVVHERNEAIIKRKLASFGIEAEVIGKNAGPVVTQYVVQPAPHIKLSRIEALADDLAMALAARSIRIEAPIPGKAAVGIEIPNQEFNVVALRRILEEVNLTDSDDQPPDVRVGPGRRGPGAGGGPRQDAAPADRRARPAPARASWSTR